MTCRRMLVLAIGFMLCSCSAVTIKEDIDLKSYQPDDTFSKNVLVVKQTRMAIPEGWSFQARTKKDSKGIFFRFVDNRSNIIGWFEWVNIKKMIEPSKLVQWFAESILKGNRDVVGRKTFISAVPSYLVTSKSANGKFDQFDALIVEGKTFNDIVVTAHDGYLYSNPEIAYKIFNSYKFERADISERTLGDLPKFRCDDRKWEWYNDIGLRGYYIGTRTGRIITIAVEETQYATLDEFAKQNKFKHPFSSPEFDVSLTIGKQTLKAVAKCFQTPDNAYEYLLTEMNGKKLVISFTIKATELKTEPTKLHEDQEVSDALRRYFSF